LQEIASNTFHYSYSVPNSLSSVLGPILICTHTVIYPACPLLPFSGIISSEVSEKRLFFDIDILVPDIMLYVASPQLMKDSVLQ